MYLRRQLSVAKQQEGYSKFTVLVGLKEVAGQRLTYKQLFKFMPSNKLNPL